MLEANSYLTRGFVNASTMCESDPCDHRTQTMIEAYVTRRYIGNH
jgi:hypothetical protein